MAAKSTDSKEVLASTSSNVVNKIHKMQWLKHDSQLMAQKSLIDNALQDLPSKKDEEYFSGTKSTKKKKEKKPKPTKIINNLTDIVTSDNVQSMHSETTENSAVPTANKSNEDAIPNGNPVRSNVANPWNVNSNVVDTLFPNVQSTTVQCMNEEEMLSLALAESIATAQLEYYRKESNEQKNVSNTLSTDSDEDGGWGVVKRNLPDPEEKTDKQTSHNPYDSNNNDHSKHAQRTSDKEIQIKFPSSESGKDKDAEGKSGIVKPFLPSCVELSVENGNDKCTDAAASLKKDDVEDSTKSKDMQMPDEKLDPVVQTSTSANIDKYGRVGGYTERHLFMGRGARRKEQEYFKEHGATLGLIKLQDQNSNRQLPHKREDTKIMIKPSDHGFFKKSEIDRYQGSNQIHKSAFGTNSFPTDFRYSRGNDRYSENRHTRGDELSNRNKIHGEQRSIRGTGIHLQKPKQDSADSYNSKRMDSSYNRNRAMKFQHSHETQATKTNEKDVNFTKNKSVHDFKEDERSKFTLKPKENLSESSILKSKSDEMSTSAVPGTTTEVISSTQNFNNSLIQNALNAKAANHQLVDGTEGKSDANFKAHTDIINISNDSSKLSSQSCLPNDAPNQTIDSSNSQTNYLPIASSSMHEQIESSDEYYLQQSMQNLKDLEYLQYLQYLHQYEGMKSENYNYPNMQSHAVQSLTENSPFSNSQYPNSPGPIFPDPSYLMPNIQQSNTLMQTVPSRFSPTQNPPLNLPRDNQFAHFSHPANVTFPNSHSSFLPCPNLPMQNMPRENMYQECIVQPNFFTGTNQLDYLASLTQNTQNPMRNFANVVHNPLTDLRRQSYLQAQQIGGSPSSQLYQTDNNGIQITGAQSLRENVNLPETPAAHFYHEFLRICDTGNERERMENCIRAPPGYNILEPDYEKDNKTLSEQKRVFLDNFGMRLPSFRARKDQTCEVPQANLMQNSAQLPQDAQSLMALLLNAQVNNQLDNSVAGNMNYYDQRGLQSNMMDYSQSIPYQFRMNSTISAQACIPNLQTTKIPPDSSSSMRIASNSPAINSQSDNLSNDKCGIPPIISPLSCMNYKTSNDSITALNSYTNSSLSSQSNANPRLGIHNISNQKSPHPLPNKDPGNKYKSISTRSIGRGRSALLKSKNL